jgi:hypothetical protein
MHHGQELLSRMQSIRSRKAYYELARLNQDSDEERTLQTRRRNLEGLRMASTVHTLSGHNGKAQSV